MTASEYLKSPAAVSKIAEFLSHLRQLKYKKKKYLLVATTLKYSRRKKKILFLFSDLSVIFYLNCFYQQNRLNLPNAFFFFADFASVSLHH